MNLKWKSIILGVAISLIIVAIIISTLSFLSASISWLGYFVYVGFFLGGTIAIYVAKLKTLKDTIIIGASVGIISFILYLIGITIVVDVLIPVLYVSQSNLPAPQAFLMAGILERYEPTIIDHLFMAWKVVLYAIVVVTFCLLGSYSFYLISSQKKKRH